MRKLLLAIAAVTMLSPFTADSASAEVAFRYVTSGLPLQVCRADNPAAPPQYLGTGSACLAAGPGQNVQINVVDDVFGPVGWTIEAERPSTEQEVIDGRTADGKPCDALNCTLAEERHCGRFDGFMTPGGTTRVTISVDTPRGTVSTNPPGPGSNICGGPVRAFGTTGIISFINF